jgi:hypothetical protein
MDSTGASYQDCAELLLGRLATLIEVPREKDFGVDFYGQPRFSSGAYTESVQDEFGVQVKGGKETLSYGGLDPKANWKQYEITWLRSLVTPLYLARVNASFEAVELFSLWPVWLILWRQAVDPFEIRFVLQEPGSTPSNWDPTATSESIEGSPGDGKRWIVDLGPPILKLTNAILNEVESRSSCLQVLREWVALDRMNLIRVHQFVPLLKSFMSWTTNSPQTSPIVIREWQFWSPSPGVNLKRLCEAAEPTLVALGKHLQSQNNEAAANLVPILSWLKEQNCLGKFGQNLLDELPRDQ